MEFLPLGSGYRFLPGYIQGTRLIVVAGYLPDTIKFFLAIIICSHADLLLDKIGIKANVVF